MTKPQEQKIVFLFQFDGIFSLYQRRASKSGPNQSKAMKIKAQKDHPNHKNKEIDFELADMLSIQQQLYQVTFSHDHTHSFIYTDTYTQIHIHIFNIQLISNTHTYILTFIKPAFYLEETLSSSYTKQNSSYKTASILSTV